MKVMSDKKFKETISSIVDEHEDKLKYKYETKIINIKNEYEHKLLKMSSEKEFIESKYYKCKSEVKELKEELESFENDKIRYLRKLENKKFKSKRLNKKYQSKLIKEINLLYGER